MADLTFDAIYEQYAQDVFRFALYLSGNRAQAEDLAAETFSRAWVARDRIDVGTVKAYLLMIARNLYIDLTRRRRDIPLAAEYDPQAAGADPESAAMARSEWEAVLRALRAMPEEERSILLMATIGGVAYDAIAVAFGISTTAVKVRVHRARVKLNAARFSKERT
jgi:RNA polymerase sigma-70 factor (ECF subfamily)